MKKNLFFLLLMGLIFASCSKDIAEHEQKMLPAGTRLQLSLSASILDDAAQQDKNNTKALDFYVDTNNKVRATLKGKTSVKIKTYLYSDNTLIWSEDVDWKVINNGAGLHFDKENIVTSAPMQVGKTKLIAILATENSPLAEPTVDRQVSVTAIEASDDGSSTSSIDVPYAMESNITVTTERGTNKGTAEPNRVFKPYGNILHFTLENTTGADVMVTGLLISDYSTKYTLKPDELSQGAKKKDADDIRAGQFHSISPGISISPNSTSTKHLLLWVGSLPSPPIVSLQVQGNASSLGYYATYTRTKDNFVAGKTYHARLKITDVKNPLSYFADGFVDKNSSVFVTMSFLLSRGMTPHETRRYIGRFSKKQIQGKERDYAAIRDMFYPAIHKYYAENYRGYRIPTTGNFNSIGLGDGMYGANGFRYIERTDGGGLGDYEFMERTGVRAAIGNHLFVNGDWEFLISKLPSQGGASSSVPPLPKEMEMYSYTNFALGYIQSSYDSQTHTTVKSYDKCYAFRYDWNSFYKSYTIYCKYVGTENITSVQQLKDKPHSFWTDGRAFFRDIPSIATKYTDQSTDASGNYIYRNGVQLLNFYSTSDPTSLPSLVPDEELRTLFGEDQGFIKRPGAAYSPGQASLWLYKVDY